MRLNKFLATYTDLSRRKADTAIENGRVKVNDEIALMGQSIKAEDSITLDGKEINNTEKIDSITLLLNKPAGYVCSKNGQGSKTVYDLLPEKYHALNIAGRLDKDSSGLVILTNDGGLLNQLTHPSFNKEKIYEVKIDNVLSSSQINMLKTGVNIGDERLSIFKDIYEIGTKKYRVILEEGRNRQIRRTFEALQCVVEQLHRIKVGDFDLEDIKLKTFITF